MSCLSYALNHVTADNRAFLTNKPTVTLSQHCLLLKQPSFSQTFQNDSSVLPMHQALMQNLMHPQHLPTLTGSVWNELHQIYHPEFPHNLKALNLVTSIWILYYPENA